MYNDAIVIRNSALSALDVDDVRKAMWDSKADWQPEKKLAAAILEDAQSCLEGKRPLDEGKARAFATAARWAMSTSRDWAFAFEPCCEAVGLEPSAVRAWWMRRYGIQKWGETWKSARR